MKLTRDQKQVITKKVKEQLKKTPLPKLDKDALTKNYNEIKTINNSLTVLNNQVKQFEDIREKIIEKIAKKYNIRYEYRLKNKLTLNSFINQVEQDRNSTLDSLDTRINDELTLLTIDSNLKVDELIKKLVNKFSL